MKGFDEAVMSIEGVYRYFRFSDDILILSWKRLDNLDGNLQQVLPDGMIFNNSKGGDFYFSGKDASQSDSFEYLGYRFSYEKRQSERLLDVQISDKKIKKLKTRLILSFKDFERTNDYRLLVQRIGFLSSNYKLKRTNISHFAQSRNIKSGIYFNYPFCGRYVGDKQAGLRRIGLSEGALRELDVFYRGILFSQRKRYADRIRSLSNPALAVLKRLSFRQGYVKRMEVKLSAERIHRVKQVWRNA